jgi:hypothetical protein
MSVCASVLAVVIAIASGISTSYWTGFACYLVATLAFVAITQKRVVRVNVEEPVAVA